MANEIQIPQGETVEVIGELEAREAEASTDDGEHAAYEFKVDGGPVRMAHHQKDARISPREYDRGQSGEIMPLGQPIYAYAPDADVTLRFSRAAFGINLFPSTKIINVESIDRVESIGTSENESSSSAGSFDPTNTPDDSAVPDGMSVVYKAPTGNADPVTVDGAFTLQPGDAVELNVTNVNVPSFSGTGGDTVEWVHEG